MFKISKTNPNWSPNTKQGLMKCSLSLESFGNLSVMKAKIKLNKIKLPYNIVIFPWDCFM